MKYISPFRKFSHSAGLPPVVTKFEAQAGKGTWCAVAGQFRAPFLVRQALVARLGKLIVCEDSALSDFLLILQRDDNVQAIDIADADFQHTILCA